MSVGNVTPPLGLGRLTHAPPTVIRAGSLNQAGGKDSGSWTKSTGPYANSTSSSGNTSATDSPEAESSPRQQPNRFIRGNANATNNNNSAPSSNKQPVVKSDPTALTPEQIANDHWPGWDDAHVTEQPFAESDSESEESSIDEASEDSGMDAASRALSADEWANWNDCHCDEVPLYRQAKARKKEDWRDWDDES
jgi:hypothetical protein